MLGWCVSLRVMATQIYPTAPSSELFSNKRGSVMEHNCISRTPLKRWQSTMIWSTLWDLFTGNLRLNLIQRTKDMTEWAGRSWSEGRSRANRGHTNSEVRSRRKSSHNQQLTIKNLKLTKKNLEARDVFLAGNRIHRKCTSVAREPY